MKYLLSVLLCVWTTLSWGVNVHTYIPPKALLYKELISTEVPRIFPGMPDYNYVPALIEHESCISLTHRRCWSPTSQLKTKREEGAGLSQITKAYRTDGTVRFDKLQELRDAYRSELRELSWENIYARPDLQIRALVLLVRQDNNRLRDVKDPVERMKFTDAAYNGGVGGVFKEQRACGIAKDCDPNQWFDHVEKYCTRSKKAIYGTRSACDLIHNHVRDVITHKLPKYTKYYGLVRPVSLQ